MCDDTPPFLHYDHTILTIYVNAPLRGTGSAGGEIWLGGQQEKAQASPCMPKHHRACLGTTVHAPAPPRTPRARPVHAPCTPVHARASPDKSGHARASLFLRSPKSKGLGLFVHYIWGAPAPRSSCLNGFSLMRYRECRHTESTCCPHFASARIGCARLRVQASGRGPPLFSSN